MLRWQKSEIYSSVQETPPRRAAVPCGAQDLPPKHPELSPVVVQPHAWRGLSMLPELCQGRSAHQHL